MLDKYTVDLTAQARGGRIDAVLGRDNEIRQMIDILLRRRQNNPILTGEPGVGKTAVVEGLAVQIAAGRVPRPLQNVALRALDLGLLQAGASVKGEFENRLRGVIDEVKASLTPIILFVDEAHTMIGAGGAAGQSDAANLLKPALARGELRTIAATTWAEYKKYFEKDAALTRRFQVVKIDEPSIETAIHMLRGVVPVLESHHGVRILDQAVVEAVTLSARYISGRQLPDKCVSVLDTACARVALSLAAEPSVITDLTNLLGNLDREEQAIRRDGVGDAGQHRLSDIDAQRQQLHSRLDELKTDYELQLKLVQEVQALRTQMRQGGEAIGAKQLDSLEKKLGKALEKLAQKHRRRALVYECVDASTVAEIIAGWTGIPLGRMVEDELATVMDLARRLGQRVIGQDHALSLIAQRIQISKANLAAPEKPKGVFLLAGPSGVGKTETALALADLLYGGERNLITINMSEYQESHSVAGLKGSPPGYVGYGEGGVLTEAVRRKPYSVVLLDEVEKAHPDVLELFFQVFDKGRLEDGEGSLVDFRNTVIILTSNVGTNLIMSAVEHGVTVGEEVRAPTPADLDELIRSDLQRHFKPALLGRLTVVPYYPVEDSVLRKIIGLKLASVRNRFLENHRAQLEFSDDLIDLIAERCFDVDSGARNAESVITDTVLSALSLRMLAAMAERKSISRIALSVENGALAVAVTE
jgi:type VI secretion system protein VasG